MGLVLLGHRGPLGLSQPSDALMWEGTQGWPPMLDAVPELPFPRVLKPTDPGHPMQHSTFGPALWVPRSCSLCSLLSPRSRGQTPQEYCSLLWPVPLLQAPAATSKVRSGFVLPKVATSLL